jgi:hypothetical protein
MYKSSANFSNCGTSRKTFNTIMSTIFLDLDLDTPPLGACLLKTTYFHNLYSLWQSILLSKVCNGRTWQQTSHAGRDLSRLFIITYL